MEEIEKFKQQLKELRRKCQTVVTVENDGLTFSGIQFHENMNPRLLDNNDLILGHTFLHGLFSKKKTKITKETIKKLHTIFSDELGKRAISHKNHDVLDES